MVLPSQSGGGTQLQLGDPVVQHGGALPQGKGYWKVLFFHISLLLQSPLPPTTRDCVINLPSEGGPTNQLAIA